MSTFFKALIKSLFGDLANSAAVTVGVLVALALVTLGATPVSGWGMAVTLLLAVVWLAGRYGSPKG